MPTSSSLLVTCGHLFMIPTLYYQQIYQIGKVETSQTASVKEILYKQNKNKKTLTI